MFQSILVPLDGSPLGERALPYAVALGARSGARLLLVEVTIANIVTRNDPQTGQPYTLNLAAEYLKEVVTRVGGDVATETLERHGEPGDEIIRVAQERRADLVAMSTHGRSGLGRWIYGSVAEHVLRHTTIPVLLITSATDHAWPSPDAGRTPRILVALDDSPTASAAVSAAAEMARALGATLLLLRVVPGGASPDPAALEGARRDLETTAAALRQSGHQVEVAAAGGPAAATIESYARDQGVDVVALGTQGRGMLGQPQLGSVASEMIHRSRVPLLLVRPQPPAPA